MSGRFRVRLFVRGGSTLTGQGLDLPDWGAATPDGLAGGQCRDAAEQGGQPDLGFHPGQRSSKAVVGPRGEREVAFGGADRADHRGHSGERAVGPASGGAGRAGGAAGSGVGRPVLPGCGPWVELEVFGTGLGRYESGFAESLDLLLAALTRGRVRGAGPALRFHEVTVVPRPGPGRIRRCWWRARRRRQWRWPLPAACRCCWACTSVTTPRRRPPAPVPPATATRPRRPSRHSAGPAGSAAEGAAALQPMAQPC